MAELPARNPKRRPARNRPAGVALGLALLAATAAAASPCDIPWDATALRQVADERKDAPALDALQQIVLPEESTAREVVDYINAILLVSRNQRQYHASDPQVSMLAMVGPQHIDKLLAVARSHVPWNAYVVEAVKLLATERDKPAILGAIGDYTPLVEVVLSKGWEEEARGILVARLEGATGYLPTEWIRAVANLRDPSTYEALKRFLIHGSNRHVTYRILKGLPGMDLSAALPEAWDNALGERYETAALTRPLLAAGYAPVLDYLIAGLDDNHGMPATLLDARVLVLRHTTAAGSNDDIRAWYAAHKDDLRFDPRSKRFVHDDSWLAAMRRWFD